MSEETRLRWWQAHLDRDESYTDLWAATERAREYIAQLEAELRTKVTWVPEGYVDGLKADLEQAEAEAEQFLATVTDLMEQRNRAEAELAAAYEVISHFKQGAERGTP